MFVRRSVHVLLSITQRFFVLSSYVTTNNRSMIRQQDMPFIILYIYVLVVCHRMTHATAILRGYCTPNLKLAYFGCNLKIINTVAKNNACILK